MTYKDPNTQLEYQRNWMAKRRADWIESQGGKCVRCGSTESLEVDHIDPSLKTMNPASIWSRSKEIKELELANCQVLCNFCHKKKTHDPLKALRKHGTTNMYSKGKCRCDLCKAANAKYRRELKLRKQGAHSKQ